MEDALSQVSRDLQRLGETLPEHWLAKAAIVGEVTEALFAVALLVDSTPISGPVSASQLRP